MENPKDFILMPLNDFYSQFKALTTRSSVGNDFEILYTDVGEIHLKSSETVVLQLYKKDIKHIEEVSAKNESSF